MDRIIQASIAIADNTLAQLMKRATGAGLHHEFAERPREKTMSGAKD